VRGCVLRGGRWPVAGGGGGTHHHHSTTTTTTTTTTRHPPSCEPRRTADGSAHPTTAAELRNCGLQLHLRTATLQFAVYRRSCGLRAPAPQGHGTQAQGRRLFEGLGVWGFGGAPGLAEQPRADRLSFIFRSNSVNAITKDLLSLELALSSVLHAGRVAT
jgi:hypothetical protein